MKKWISVLLVAVLLAGLFFVGRTSRGSVHKVPNEPAEVTGGKEDDPGDDQASLEDPNEDPDNEQEDEDTTEDGERQLKIGVILIGDETENYSKSHIEGITQAAQSIGITRDQIEWKERISDSDSSYDAVSELLDDGCNFLIANAAVHQDAMTDAATDNPDDRFVVIGGNNAAFADLDNYYNAYTDIYEARYVSGVVAGMKLKQLDRKGKIGEHGYDDAGNVRVGYIAAFRNAEAISGYTAFYLGMRSVMGNVVMEVQYTNKWLDIDAEATAADAMIRSGCPLIAQSTNSNGAAETVEKAWDSGKHVYYIGCSTQEVQKAPNAALTSAVSDWSVYYTKLLKAVSEEQEFVQDWNGGLKEGAVSVTKLGKYAAPKTAEKVDKVIRKIRSGKLHIFDTAKFTVAGKHIWSNDAMIDLSITDGSTDEVSEDDVIKSALVSYDGGTYFGESMLRSAPYFTLHIDGITELNAEDEG